MISGDAFAHLIGFGEFPAWGGASTFRASVVRALRFAPELPICEDLHFCLRAYSGCAHA